MFDLKDLGELGVEITFLDYTKMSVPPDEAQTVIADLKAQIRSRKDPLDRSEHWEGYEVMKGCYVNASHLEGHIYSFDKEKRILMSRMSSDEKRDLGWTV